MQSNFLYLEGIAVVSVHMQRITRDRYLLQWRLPVCEEHVLGVLMNNVELVVEAQVLCQKTPRQLVDGPNVLGIVVPTHFDSREAAQLPIEETKNLQSRAHSSESKEEPHEKY